MVDHIIEMREKVVALKIVSEYLYIGFSSGAVERYSL